MRMRLTFLVIVTSLLVLGSVASAFDLVEFFNYLTSKILPTGMVTAQTGYDECNNGVGWSEPTSAAQQCGWPRGSKGYVKDCCCCYIKAHVHDLGDVFEDRDVEIKYRPAYGSGNMIVYYSVDGSLWKQLKKINVPWRKITYKTAVHIPEKFRYIKLKFDTGRYLDWSSVKVLPTGASPDLYIKNFGAVMDNRLKIIYVYGLLGNKGQAPANINIVLYVNNETSQVKKMKDFGPGSTHDLLFNVSCAPSVKLKVCVFPMDKEDLDYSDNCRSITTGCVMPTTTTTIPEKPDLYVKELQVFKENGTYRATTIVGNKGNATGDGRLVFFVNVIPKFEKNITLSPGAEYTQSYDFNCIGSQTHIKVCIFTQGLNDSDSSNNCQSRTVNCSIITTTTTIPTSKVPPCDSYGDVNNDGYVNEEDFELVSQCVRGVTTCSSQADVNGDGKVNFEDTLLINQYIHDLVSTFPVCQMKTPPCDSYGDVDSDGYVTSDDNNLIRKYMTGQASLTQEQLHRADVNADGEVNVLDIQTISLYVNGTISTFPVCEEQKNISIDQFTCTPVGSLKAQCNLKFSGLDSDKIYSIYVGGNKVDEDVYAAGITVFSNSNQATVIVVAPKEGGYQLGAWLFEGSTPDITQPALTFWEGDPIDIEIRLR